MLYPLSIFVEDEAADQITVDSGTSTYWYESFCAKQRHWRRLPRTLQAEKVARSLMAQLATDRRYSREGKMYGILLVRTATGKVQVLKAFSGLLNGCSNVDGWVPPIPGRDRISVAEAQTLAQLETIKQELIQLSQLPARQQLDQRAADFAEQLRSQMTKLCDRKQQRHRLREQLQATLSGDALTTALADLDRQSQQDGIARRRLKQQRDAALRPLQDQVNAADAKMRQLKCDRKQISRQLQAQMHAAYQLTNFAGESSSLDQLMPALPTGTGDCCAPKLLHYAATHGLEPLAMAEFWWDGTFDHAANNAGEPEEKRSGQFYGACAERCQPIMGFLLSGLSHFTEAVVGPHPQSLSQWEMDFERTPFAPGKKAGDEEQQELTAATDRSAIAAAQLHTAQELNVIYEDADLIVVNKPTGLLSVPGRYLHNQDSVLSRLRCQLQEGELLSAVHRLDQDTSGVLLIARHPAAARQLRQQFQHRQVQKRYVAVLVGQVITESGMIEVPLSADPANRPLQRVDWQQGKPCITKFQVLNRIQKAGTNYTEIEFFPVTGRTHQLRVHAAAPEGLTAPILGDRLYGCTHRSVTDNTPHRLHLHAQSLQIQHPSTGAWLQLQTSVAWSVLSATAS